MLRHFWIVPIKQTNKINNFFDLYNHEQHCIYVITFMELLSQMLVSFPMNPDLNLISIFALKTSTNKIAG